MLGRFPALLLPIAIAGFLAEKKRAPQTSGTLLTNDLTFAAMLLGTVLLVGALSFMPAVVLGPVADHLTTVSAGPWTRGKTCNGVSDSFSDLDAQSGTIAAMTLLTPTRLPDRPASDVQALKLQRRQTRRLSLFEPALVKMATGRSFLMLDPRNMARNPVMFLVEVGWILTTLVTIQSIATGAGLGLIIYQAALAILLLLTVLFANFAEALAEARGKAQAQSLRATRQDTVAYRLEPTGETTEVSSTELKTGDRVVVEMGQIIPADGEIVEGVASVDESAITGESAPVIREAGGDRSGVTGGTRVLSDRIVVQVTAGVGESFLDRMIALVEGASRQKTPNEIALTIILAAFSIIFLIVTATLYPMARYFDITLDIPTLIALLVCLIPTTIGALLAAIGIAGMDRALAANLIAKSGKAVEVAGDIDTLLLDKTGTITLGNRKATLFVPMDGTVRIASWPGWPRWPRWRTRLRRARASSSWPASSTRSISRPPPAAGSSSSPPRPA